MKQDGPRRAAAAADSQPDPHQMPTDLQLMFFLNKVAEFCFLYNDDDDTATLFVENPEFCYIPPVFKAVIQVDPVGISEHGLVCRNLE